LAERTRGVDSGGSGREHSWFGCLLLNLRCVGAR
jgi:hypothetical protein